MKVQRRTAHDHVMSTLLAISIAVVILEDGAGNRMRIHLVVSGRDLLPIIVHTVLTHIGHRLQPGTQL